MIQSIGDETRGASMECSSLGGNRIRLPEGDSLVVVNTFFDPDWGLGKRETVSNSLRRFDNMTARLAENAGKVDANQLSAAGEGDYAVGFDDLLAVLGGITAQGGRGQFVDADQAGRRPDDPPDGD